MTIWKEITLSDIGKVVTGKTPPTSDVSFYGGAYPFITPTDMKDDYNYCTTDRYLSDGGKNLQKSILLPKNAVCYTCIASIGKMCLTQKESFTNQQINSVIVDENKAHYKFIFYLLKYLTPQIKKMAGGTITGIINKGQFENFPFEIPDSIEEQKEIAGVLSSLDDKIELLREENKTLEATAQTIFKEWFVNFNFPNAEGNPYKSSGGKMIDSEHGEIPEGWRVGKLGEEVKIAYGKNLPTNKLTVDGYPVFGGNGQIGFYEKFLYEDPHVLVSCRGEASGKVNISLPNSFVTNNSLILEIPKKSDLNFSFLKFFSLNTDYEVYVSGSAQPQITIETIKHCPILIPDKRILFAYDGVIKPVTAKILASGIQIKTLSIFRDTLLPKLMSGDVVVDGFNSQS